MGKVKQYYHEAEENSIASMIENLDWGDADAHPTISEHTRYIMGRVKPVFHTEEDIKLMKAKYKGVNYGKFCKRYSRT